MMAIHSVFSPQSKAELKSATTACLALSPKCECSTGLRGPIGGWDVSNVTDMSHVFEKATSFDGDISKWDVSRVNDMGSMFRNAIAFNADISKWDVSAVGNMDDRIRGEAGDLRKLLKIVGKFRCEKK